MEIRGGEQIEASARDGNGNSVAHVCPLAPNDQLQLHKVVTVDGDGGVILVAAGIDIGVV